ncbi:unnamed protein product [Prunus armeniaca]|uniref:Uncharacterized protein n=1 Tax=Prunus armeniaca TaxID=36596 RepID=A0A6J5X8C1_PRUAR|nr:unnamed protein product [Prunus armeniaca]
MAMGFSSIQTSHLRPSCPSYFSVFRSCPRSSSSRSLWTRTRPEVCAAKAAHDTFSNNTTISLNPVHYHTERESNGTKSAWNNKPRRLEGFTHSVRVISWKKFRRLILQIIDYDNLDKTPGEGNHVDKVNGEANHVDKVNGEANHVDKVNGEGNHVDKVNGYAHDGLVVSTSSRIENINLEKVNGHAPEGPRQLDEAAAVIKGDKSHAKASAIKAATKADNDCKQDLRIRLNTIYDKVLVVNSVSVAKKVVKMLTDQYRNLVHACDTEVAKIEVKRETPVDHGEIICFSIYSGPGVDFGNGSLVFGWMFLMAAARNFN